MLLSVRLPSRVVLTHSDLLRLDYDHNTAAIDAALEVDATLMQSALLLPGLRTKLVGLGGTAGDETERRRVRHRLADAWLF